jgi:hypothetical protein
MTPLLAAEIPDFALTALKIFALIGIAAVGALLLGWMASMIARLYFLQKIPPGPMWFIRTLGFAASGLIAYFVLFGGGGGGFGGTGWGWGGGGPKEGVVPKKDESVRKDRDKEKDKDSKKDDKDAIKVTPEQSLRVEVLGDPALKRLTKSEDFDSSKRYRLPTGPELLTLDEVKKQVLARREADPPLRLLEIVLYNDSPDRKRPQVELLETWARDLSRAAPLTVKVSDEERDAP